MAVIANRGGFGSYLVPLALLALAGPVSAAGITYETTYIGGGRYVPNGHALAGTMATDSPLGRKYHPISATLPKAAFGTVARGMLRGGIYGVAIQGAIEAGGYLADRYTGEIATVEQVVEETGTDVCFTAHSWCETAGTLVMGPSSQQFCSGDGASYNRCLVVSSDSAVAWSCAPGRCEVYVMNSGRMRAGCSTTPPVVEVVGTETVPVTDYGQVDNIIWENLSDTQKLAIAEAYLRSLSPRGTVSTEQYPFSSVPTANPTLQQAYADWPELQAAVVGIINAETAAYLQSTDPQFQPSPDEQAQQDQATDQAPVEPPPEWPAFCDWAPMICEPFAGGEQPPVPRMDFDVPEYDSGLPTMAACPAPVQLSLGAWGSQEISLTPACDVASAIRGPLLALSYLIAAFIVVGVRR